jgi:hypothetical protein
MKRTIMAAVKRLMAEISVAEKGLRRKREELQKLRAQRCSSCEPIISKTSA